MIVDPAPANACRYVDHPQNELQQLWGHARGRHLIREFMESQQAELIDIRTLVNAVCYRSGASVPGIRSPRVSLFSAKVLQCRTTGPASLSGNGDQLAAVGMTRRYGESRSTLPPGRQIPSLQFNLLLRPICHALWAQLSRSAVLTGTDSSALWHRKLAKTCYLATGLAFINPYLPSPAEQTL